MIDYGRMINTGHINSGARFKKETQFFSVLWKQYYLDQLGHLLSIWQLGASVIASRSIAHLGQDTCLTPSIDCKDGLRMHGLRWEATSGPSLVLSMEWG